MKHPFFAASVLRHQRRCLSAEQICATIEQICSMETTMHEYRRPSRQHARRTHARTSPLHPDARRAAPNRQEHCDQTGARPGRPSAPRRLGKHRLLGVAAASRPMANQARNLINEGSPIGITRHRRGAASQPMKSAVVRRNCMGRRYLERHRPARGFDRIVVDPPSTRGLVEGTYRSIQTIRSTRWEFAEDTGMRSATPR